MLWCRPMWHIFPRGDHMEIESLRLDFLTLIIRINITKAQNISEHIRAYQRRKKKKKKPEEPRQRGYAWVTHDLGRAWRLGGATARCLGCMRPKAARATQAVRSLGHHYRRGVLEVLLSFFCFFLSGFLFGCSENHKVWIFMFFPQIWWLCFGFLKFFFLCILAWTRGLSL